MFRDIQKARTRKEFVTMCLNHPDLGASHLKRIADKLRKTKTTRDRVEVLSELLYLTERTIYSDCVSDN